MKKIILGLVLSLIPLNVVLADEKPYGAGGCGLGSMIMGKNGNQVMAITTNDTGTQTFAITSGTSNCVKSGVVQSGKEARVFIEVNQRQLANDIAKGSGDTVSSLAQLYQCQNHRQLGSVLQKNYKKIFPQATVTADQVESSIEEVILKEQVVNCNRG